MRTLLFCTSWFDSKQLWNNIYGRWLKYNTGAGKPFVFDHLLFIDDASPIAPDDPRVEVIHEDEWPDTLPPVALYRHRERLGRPAMLDYPGWWRSYFRSLDFARRYGFGKIIHAECDAYVLSQRLADHLNALDREWTSLWCPRYVWPETAIQVICQDEFAEMQLMCDAGYQALKGRAAEFELPFSNIETRWTGDRYGDYRNDIPAEADYACQVHPHIILPPSLR
jgi:hypothetical protein